MAFDFSFMILNPFATELPWGDLSVYTRQILVICILQLHDDAKFADLLFRYEGASDNENYLFYFYF
jgi:hypothetical protein